MIELGKFQKLIIVDKIYNDIFLNEKNGGKEDAVILPKKELDRDMAIGEEIEVFIYTGTKNMPTATLKTPKVTLGEIAFLKVVSTIETGAFLDWGLPKDLFLPDKQQREKVKKDKMYLVGLFINRDGRLCATMDVYSQLRSDSPYKTNDWVQGTMYSFSEELGAFVAVDDKYHGLIPKEELSRKYSYGERVEVRVSRVREDGRLELSFRKEIVDQIMDDAERIYQHLVGKGGEMKFNDKSSPEEIKAEFNMSKNAFKKAIGKLWKERRIEMTEDSIKILGK